MQIENQNRLDESRSVQKVQMYSVQRLQHCLDVQIFTCGGQVETGIVIELHDWPGKRILIQHYDLAAPSVAQHNAVALVGGSNLL